MCSGIRLWKHEASKWPQDTDLSNAPRRFFAKTFFSHENILQKQLNALRLNETVFEGLLVG